MPNNLPEMEPLKGLEQFFLAQAGICNLQNESMVMNAQEDKARYWEGRSDAFQDAVAKIRALAPLLERKAQRDGAVGAAESPPSRSADAGNLSLTAPDFDTWFDSYSRIHSKDQWRLKDAWDAAVERKIEEARLEEAKWWQDWYNEPDNSSQYQHERGAQRIAELERKIQS